MRLDDRLDEKFNRYVRSVDAAWPRAANSVLDPRRDRLVVVYEVFDAVHRSADADAKRVNFLFCHGSGMNRAVWEYYAEKLASVNRGWIVNKIVLVDQVTHGDSWVANQGKLGLEFDWFDGARDIVLVAEREFSHRDGDINVIIGHSMGGFQALAAIAHSPTLFQFSLVIEPVIIKTKEQLDPNRKYTMLTPNFYAAMERKMVDEFADERTYNEFINKVSLYATVHPEIKERMRQFEKLENANGTISTKIKKVHQTMCYITPNLTGHRMIALLKFIPCPVVLLVGGDSKWTPPENNEIIMTNIPTCSKVVVPNGLHMVNLEMPDTVIRHITERVTEFVQQEQRHVTRNPRHLTHAASKTERALFLDHHFNKVVDDIRARRTFKL